MDEQTVKKIRKRIRQLMERYVGLLFWFDVLPKTKAECKIIKDRYNLAVDEYYKLVKKHAEKTNTKADRKE